MSDLQVLFGTRRRTTHDPPYEGGLLLDNTHPTAEYRRSRSRDFPHVDTRIQIPPPNKPPATPRPSLLAGRNEPLWYDAQSTPESQTVS
ncbi:hypothetical protein M407DRAFT_27550 [Tulasnella calospora MUT 4182]|uniref:Uncharacterized protein n=1 Tax=Tulasnella calospora MUT 4182 TaxID=1051891 RepID=A0A0C3KNJ0_9AGAM|nr:hypothetical protein M407DRAFT_27550 [Tulasnella calospora MUT 4182]